MALTSSISELAPAVSNRLEDPLSIFWLQQYEVYAGIAEAMSEMLLLVGRPTATVNLQITIQPNVVWQAMPEGVLAITDINTNLGRLRKTSLHALDTALSSWSPAWESERAAYPRRWAPVGINMFVVHPAVLEPVFANVTGIQYPVQSLWPPSGSELLPFHREFNQALGMYAASYCRIKEVGEDAQEGLALYQSFLEIGQRLSAIEDRRDCLVWTRSIGVATAPSQVTAR